MTDVISLISVLLATTTVGSAIWLAGRVAAWRFVSAHLKVQKHSIDQMKFRKQIRELVDALRDGESAVSNEELVRRYERVLMCMMVSEHLSKYEIRNATKLKSSRLNLAKINYAKTYCREHWEPLWLELDGAETSHFFDKAQLIKRFVIKPNVKAEAHEFSKVLSRELQEAG